MKAKLLNPLQDAMEDLSNHAIDLLAQNANSSCYAFIKDWFGNCILMYALTVASGNNTYLKETKYVFDTHIISRCENKSHCNDISLCLEDMISLLTA